MTLPDSARELLDLLGLAPAPPSPRAFEDLFLRFQARVPYETLSRARRGGPLAPEELFTALVEEGGGSSGAERVRAFAALARGLGYDASVVAGEARGGASEERRAHLAIVARIGREEVLADAAYPLPVLLPLAPPASEVPTPFGKVSVARDGTHVAVEVDGRGESGVRVRLDLGARADDAGEDDPDDASPLLLRVLDDRVLRLAGGALHVEDPWSRLSSPYDPRSSDPLRTLFAREDLTDDELAAMPPAASGPARLAVFDRSELPPSDVLARLRTPAGLLGALPPGTRAEDVVEDAAGWSWSLRDEEGSEARRERVTRTEAGVRVSPESGALLERVYAVEPASGGARLTLSAALAREVPPLGLGESARKTLVFHLVSELLALGRVA